MRTRPGAGLWRAVLWFGVTVIAVPQAPGREAGRACTFADGQCQSPGKESFQPEGCLSSESEPTSQQRIDWQSFMSQELREAPRSLLEVGSGQGLVGFWFVHNANARYLQIMY